MTEDTTQAPASTTDGESPEAAPASKKAAPRRRTVRKTAPVENVEAGGNGVEAGQDGEAKPAVKKAVRRPRKVVPVENADGAEPSAAAQPPVLSAAAMERSPSVEAHVETRVIEPKTFKAVERRAEEIFHPDGQAEPAGPALQPATPAPAAPPAPAEPAPVSPATVPEEPIIGPSTVEVPSSPAPHPAVPPQENTSQQQPRGSQQGFQGRGEGRFDRRDGQQQGHGRQDRFERRDGRQGGQGGQGGQSYQDRQGQQGGGGQFNRHQQGQGGNYRQQNQNDGGNYRQQGQGDGGGFRPQNQGNDGYRPQNQGNDGGNERERSQDGQGSDGVSRVTEPQFAEGIVEVSGKGFGFLREPKRNFVQTPADVFVTPEVCRKYNLRDGQWIKGEVRRSSRGPQLFRLVTLNGEDPEKFRNLPNFEELTSINPKKRIRLETTPERYTTRVMDLMTPVGKGQRGLIVAPPRTGKTTLLQHIGEAVIKNHPEMKLIILLVDERPEEVTEIRRSVPQAEIMASSNDSDLKSHTRIAQLAMERAKRLVEAGFDVFMLLDSITRMGRAFNNTSAGGRTGSGGIDSRALEIPRKIFAAARNTEEAGSLTIMATALIETGSRGDEVIFLEFKGTGNMELVLDRKISDQRIFPAVDIFQSGTRREELLLQPWELDKINVIRRGLAGHKPLEAIERLLSFLKKFPTNAQMLTSLPG